MSKPDPNPAKTRIWGDKAERIEAGLTAIDADLAALVTDVAYGKILSRPGLDLKTRELLAIVLLVSAGSEDELKTHIFGARNCGATLTEIRESILQASMFIGFPNVIRAMKVLASLRLSEEPTTVTAPTNKEHP